MAMQDENASHRRIWLLVCFLLVPLVLAIGIGVGVMLPRVSSISAPSTPQSAGGVMVEELKADEELFALVGQKALVFKCLGGDIDFWIEVEQAGKTQRYGPGTGGARGRNMFLPDGKDAPPGPNDQIESHFVFCRIGPDESGNEHWVVAAQRGLVSAKSSGLKVSTPVVEGQVALSKEDRHATTASVSWDVSLWKEQKKSQAPSKPDPARKTDPKRLSTSSSGSFRESSNIPWPLPADRTVCIKTVTEEGRKDHPQDKGKELVAQHVIRVMCKVASDEANGKK